MTTAATTCEKVDLTSFGNGSYGSVQPVLEKHETALLLLLGFGGVSILLAVAHRLVRRHVYHDVDNVDTAFDAGGRVSTSLTAVTVASQFLWPGDFLQSSTITVKSGVSGPFWYTVGAALNIALFPIVSVYLKTRAPGAKTYLQDQSKPDLYKPHRTALTINGMMILLGILSVLLASHMACCSQTTGRQLQTTSSSPSTPPSLSTVGPVSAQQTKMDIVLESVVEITHSIHELRDAVTSIQEQYNATAGCYPTQCSNCSHGELHSVNYTTEFRSNEQDELIYALQKDLRDEKATTRILIQKLKTIAAVVRSVDDVKTDCAENETSNDVKEEVNGKLSEQHKLIDDVASTVDDLTKEQRTATDTISKLSSTVDNLKKELGDQIKIQSEKIGVLERTMDELKADSKLLDDFVLPSLGFRRYGTSLYKLYSNKLNWPDAQQQCLKDGFYLAEINDDEEFKFTHRWLGSTDAWLGATDMSKEGDWRWSKSNLKVNGNWWANGQPDNSGSIFSDENCMGFSGTQFKGKITDWVCSDKYMFICEFGPVMVHGTSMYKFHMNTVTWTQAQTSCKDEGFYLAEINDDDEDEFLRMKVGKFNYWVGGTDSKDDGTWLWATSGLAVSGSLWVPGEPSVGANQDCMHANSSQNKGSNTAYCNAKLMFVCEKELHAE